LEHFPGTLSGEQGGPSAVDNLIFYIKDCWTKAGLNHLDKVSDSTLKKFITPILAKDIKDEFKASIPALCAKVAASKFMSQLNPIAVFKRNKDDPQLFNYEVILAGLWDDKKSVGFDANRGIIRSKKGVSKW
jgi:hypothetical protein